MNYYLIGMPGSGKSFLGEQLAFSLNYQFVDLDAWIEKDCLLFISEIFEIYGEETFRKQETRVLKELQGDNLVVATGGGIILEEENMKAMKGKIIFIDSPLEILKERLKDDVVRPVLRDKTVERLYQERYDLYVKYADVVFKGNTIEELLEAII